MAPERCRSGPPEPPTGTPVGKLTGPSGCSSPAITGAPPGAATWVRLHPRRHFHPRPPAPAHPPARARRGSSFARSDAGRHVRSLEYGQHCRISPEASAPVAISVADLHQSGTAVPHGSRLDTASGPSPAVLSRDGPGPVTMSRWSRRAVLVCAIGSFGPISLQAPQPSTVGLEAGTVSHRSLGGSTVVTLSQRRPRPPIGLTTTAARGCVPSECPLMIARHGRVEVCVAPTRPRRQTTPCGWLPPVPLPRPPDHPPSLTGDGRPVVTVTGPDVRR
jgi:hypothetical protein